MALNEPIIKPMSDLKKNILRGRIDELAKVSTVPSILKKIIEVIEDKNSSVADLEKVIEHDQSIALRIVGVSNAVFYGFPRRISSISQAILVLGFDMVKGLAVSTAVFNALSKENSEMVLNLWTHSFEVALAASELAGKTGCVAKDSAFMTGLLHDIGRPIFYQLFGKQYCDIASLGKIELVQAEEGLFGATHTEAGAWFAEKCKLPENCVTAIKLHHWPELYRIDHNDPLSCLIPVVYLADLLAEEGPVCMLSPAHTRVLTSLGVTKEMIAEIKALMSPLREEIKKYYSL